MAWLWATNDNGLYFTSLASLSQFRNSRSAEGPLEVLAPNLALPDDVVSYADTLENGSIILSNAGLGVSKNGLSIFLAYAVPQANNQFNNFACDDKNCLELGVAIGKTAKTLDALNLADATWGFYCLNNSEEAVLAGQSEICGKDFENVMMSRRAQAGMATGHTDFWKATVTTWLEQGEFREIEPYEWQKEEVTGNDS